MNELIFLVEEAPEAAIRHARWARVSSQKQRKGRSLAAQVFLSEM